MTPIETFWAEPTGRTWRFLRRWVDRPYVAGETLAYTCEAGWHEARARIEDVDGTDVASGDTWPHDDPRWPAECGKGCGYRFVEADRWQLFASHEYRSTRDGATFVLNEAPPGAMWNAEWMPASWRGPDGIALVVACPQKSGERTLDWHVDGRASNCTMKDDDVHQCWVRHGDPRTDRVTVDKNGLTCAAGAGSIQIGDWHGFLRDGRLVE